MDGGSFDKAIRTHLLIDAAIYQHIMKFAVTDEELNDMRIVIEKLINERVKNNHTEPRVAKFEQKFAEIFKHLADGGRMPALWTQYHHMVNVIKVFIRTERLANHHGHLSCIVTEMLHVFAASGHHQYAKGARLFCQLMKEYEISSSYNKIFKALTAQGNHVVRYSSHEWSGT